MAHLKMAHLEMVEGASAWSLVQALVQVAGLAKGLATGLATGQGPAGRRRRRFGGYPSDRPVWLWGDLS